MKYELAPEEKTFKYKIICPTPQDYELTLTLKSNTRLMNYIFKKAKSKLKRKRGIDLKDKTPELITCFDVPEQYYNFLKISLKGVYNQAKKIFKKDDIILLSHTIKRVTFVLNKNTNFWEVNFLLKGIYTKNEDITNN